MIPARDSQGELHSLILSGVERFRGNDVWEGNIILDVTAETDSTVDSTDVTELFGFDGGSESFLKVMSRFASRELVLFHLNPSYGCSISCVCKGVEARANWLPGIVDI